MRLLVVLYNACLLVAIAVPLLNKTSMLRPVHTPRVVAPQRALPHGNARQNDVLTNEIADFTYEYSFTHTREVYAGIASKRSLYFLNAK